MKGGKNKHQQKQLAVENKKKLDENKVLIIKGDNLVLPTILLRSKCTDLRPRAKKFATKKFHAV